jgi:hypothetical protein
MDKYTVIVGNIGTVYSGNNPIEAKREFGEMKRASQAPFGRASGEPVCLMCEGEILKGFYYAPDTEVDYSNCH